MVRRFDKNESPWHHKDRFRHRALKMGSKWLGGGRFGSVYSHPKRDDVVLKVGPLTDGWLLWAAYCSLNPTNPHFLKVHRIRMYPKMGVYVAQIERLEDTVYGAGRKEGATVKQRLTFGRWYSVRLWFRGDNAFEDAAFKLICELEGAHLWSDLKKVLGFREKFGISADLHDENVMWRRGPGRGRTLVITDPFSSSSDKAAKELGFIATARRQLEE